METHKRGLGRKMNIQSLKSEKRQQIKQTHQLLTRIRVGSAGGGAGVGGGAGEGGFILTVRSD